MANILRMDLYRLVHGKSLWIFLGIIVVLAAAGAGTMAVITDPTFLESMKVSYTNGAPAGVNIGFTSPSGPDADDLLQADALAGLVAQGLTPEALIGNVFLGGGGLSSLFAVFVAIFLATEFESGFSKNVFTCLLYTSSKPIAATIRPVRPTTSPQRPQRRTTARPTIGIRPVQGTTSTAKRRAARPSTSTTARPSTHAPCGSSRAGRRELSWSRHAPSSASRPSSPWNGAGASSKMRR